MTPTQIIAAKRDGKQLSAADIECLIDKFVAGEVADYQMSAFAMAVYIQGMSLEETVVLTAALRDSGETLSWHARGENQDDSKPIVDKHSTGGIGDKVSLVLAPLLACFDLRVPMISGRGLGPTGGTLDKLESIPGFRSDLSLHELQSITNTVGCVIAGASAELAPADRSLYALRDVTATVASQPLIVSSILSKKLAENLNSLVLDVKVGSGAFMKTLPDARNLAESLVHVGNHLGVQTTALLTNMWQPLGRMIGNALEVGEAIDALSQQGHPCPDLLELTVRLGAELLLANEIAESEKEAHRMLLEKLRNGEAFEKFTQMVRAQDGNLSQFKRHELKPTDVLAERAGFVRAIDGEALGNAVIHLGGGRQQTSDQIDYAVGLDVSLKIGDAIEPNQPIAKVYSRSDFDPELIRNAFVIDEASVEKLPLVYDRIA